MSYVKRPIIETAEITQKTYTGDGILSQFALDQAVADTKQLEVVVNGTQLVPTYDFTLNTAKDAILLTSVPLNGQIVYIRIFEISSLDTSGSTQATTTHRLQYQSEWVPAGTSYEINDIVTVSANSYVCLVDHNSGNSFSTDLAGNYWELLAKAFAYKSNWVGSYRYYPNDIVKDGANLWVCLNEHFSQAYRVLDDSNWQFFVPGFQYKDVYTEGVRYKFNDIVKYGGNLYLAKVEHVATDTFNPANYDLFLKGLQFEAEWSSLTQYQDGDIVRYGGNTYIALQDSLNVSPIITTYWSLIVPGFNFVGIWEGATTYKPGDTVSFGGQIYVAKLEHSNSIPATTPARWDLLLESIAWSGAWQENVNYIKGSIVKFNNIAYIAKSYHQSTSSITPENAIYWDILLEGPAEIVSAVGSSPNVFFVGPDGADISTQGKTTDNPFLTIRYGLGVISSIATAVKPCTLFVKAGMYEEVTPIIMPPYVSIVGDDTSTVFVKQPTNYAGQVMFTIQSSCALKNMTLQGKTGTIGTPATSGTPRVTNTAYITFNAGSGPSDSNVWITNAPTIANVNFDGNGCLGCDFDGSLHSGGSKTAYIDNCHMTLDDGIGIRSSGNATVEATSVHTYYTQIGLLTETNGRIRTVGGSNSYGNYGISAEGYIENANNGQGQTVVDGTIDDNQVRINNLSGTIYVGSVLNIAGNSIAFKVIRITDVTSTEKIFTLNADYTATGQVNCYFQNIQSEILTTAHQFFFVGTGNKATTDGLADLTVGSDSAKETNIYDGSNIVGSMNSNLSGQKLGNKFEIDEHKQRLEFTGYDVNFGSVNNVQIGGFNMTGSTSVKIARVVTDTSLTAATDTELATARAIKYYIDNIVSNPSSGFSTIQYVNKIFTLPRFWTLS